jgi:hypothetical protein
MGLTVRLSIAVTHQMPHFSEVPASMIFKSKRLTLQPVKKFAADFPFYTETYFKLVYN